MQRRFIRSMITARNGECVTEEVYVYLPGIPGGKEIVTQLGVDYCAVGVILGATGAVQIVPIGGMLENEQKLLEVAINHLKTNIETVYVGLVACASGCKSRFENRVLNLVNQNQRSLIR